MSAGSGHTDGRGGRGVHHGGQVVRADYTWWERIISGAVAALNGREFSRLKWTPGHSSVAVIDEDLAIKFRPGEQALGRQLQLANDAQAEVPRILEIVGVVPTVRNNIIESRPVPHRTSPV